MIRLYGHLRGSFRTVSEGLKHAFAQLGVLDGYVIGEQQDIDSEPIPGATAPVAVVTGDPMRVLMAHNQGMHREIWLMLAPNSEGVPPALKKQLGEAWGSRPTVDGFLAPSSWARDVLKREFPNHPVELCAHGVLPAFAVDEPLRKKRLQELGSTIHAAHFTSSRLDRKQTRPLVRVWKSLRDAGTLSGTLFLYTNPEHSAELEGYVRQVQAQDVVRVFFGQNLDYAHLAALYQSMSLIVQPSRAEGFGLVPLECAACGVPSVLTLGTGHLEYATVTGQVGIPLGPLGDSDDYWGAKAPTLEEDTLHFVLKKVVEDIGIDQLSLEAMAGVEEVRRRWTWEHGASNIVEKWKEKHGPGK